MNLAQIRQRTNDRLNQAVGQFYPDDYLNRVINEAYRDIANEIAAMGFPRVDGDGGDYVDVTVTSAAREYVIDQQIMAIVDVTRVLDDGTEEAVEIRPYSMRNTARPGWGNDCYVVRQLDYFNEWKIGTIAREPAAQTLRVYFRSDLVELGADNDVPLAVPLDQRDVIPVRAAMIVLEDENREIGSLAAIYVEKMDRMRRCLSGAVKGHASKAW